MLAVIETGGKQYTVSSGDKIIIEKISGKVGDAVTFHHVLLVSDNKKTDVGAPFLETTVTGKILEHGRADKIRVFKMKAKKRYQRTQGHRQSYTTVEITTIGGSDSPKKSVSQKKETEEKPASIKKESPKKSTAEKKPTQKKEVTPKKSTKTTAASKKTSADKKKL